MHTHVGKKRTHLDFDALIAMCAFWRGCRATLASFNLALAMRSSVSRSSCAFKSCLNLGRSGGGRAGEGGHIDQPGLLVISFIFGGTFRERLPFETHGVLELLNNLKREVVLSERVVGDPVTMQYEVLASASPKAMGPVTSKGMRTIYSNVTGIRAGSRPRPTVSNDPSWTARAWHVLLGGRGGLGGRCEVLRIHWFNSAGPGRAFKGTGQARAPTRSIP